MVYTCFKIVELVVIDIGSFSGSTYTYISIYKKCMYVCIYVCNKIIYRALNPLNISNILLKLFQVVCLG